MGRRKKAKYQIGDTVVITIYGTVGKVTNVQWVDGTYVYEVNKSNELYKEASLQLLAEYDGEILEKEHIDIEYKFFIGDIVQIKEQGPDFYKIIGFRTEIWRYKDRSWEDIIYELARLGDGEWMEASEADLILLADVENAEAFMQKLGLLYFIKNQNGQETKELALSIEKKETQPDDLNRDEQINRLLDIYNDYRFLYEWFQDEEYLHVMGAAIRELKRLTKNDNKKA
ncbi:hypothetical protein JMM81_17050 [Bacillus sp. V3B]|uniref:hypothetical protein n=1 Tax=Bacillus sp. V3B TaxID=2804915 RepID=UPI0021091867|nr:hypothetical protein [Bacillus sp. V3B]MCQ6276623.1 hypothetical protein [Bacillus sp. V3B]